MLMWPGIRCKHLSTLKVNNVAAVTTCIDFKDSDGAGLEHLSGGFIGGNSHTDTQKSATSVNTYAHTHTLNINAASC